MKMEIEQEAVQMEIVITWNMISEAPRIQGCDKNPYAALAMLDYALARVRRAITTWDIQNEMRTAPRVAIPGGPLA